MKFGKTGQFHNEMRSVAESIIHSSTSLGCLPEAKTLSCTEKDLPFIFAL